MKIIKQVVNYILSLIGVQLILRPHQKNSNRLHDLRLGNFTIKAPAGHDLFNIHKFYPNYGWNLTRLANSLKTKYRKLKIIDIGANIGDSAALLKNSGDWEIICIEGDNDYFAILQMNISLFNKVYAYKYYMGDKSELIPVSITKNKGTASINFTNKKSQLINILALDDFLSKNPTYKSAKLLKIDTDGYDNNVILGGKNYIRITTPVIFLEYDQTLSKADIEKVLTFLEETGYDDAIFYDNFGRLLISTNLKNHLQLKQLCTYIRNHDGAFPYFDIALFHSNDKKLANLFIRHEISLLERNQ